MVKKNNNALQEIITCHDNLLHDLVCMDNIVYKEVDNKPYLINLSKGRGYEIGFRVDITKGLIKDSQLYTWDELEEFNQNILLGYCERYLILSDVEFYIYNILLDNYLNSNTEICEISLKEIERKYRNKVIGKRNIVISKPTYDRYIDVLDNLSIKEIYLKTENYFRQQKYGVNNRRFSHKLLKLINAYEDGSNNIKIVYSLGAFGKVLKLSRRYSTFLPARCYHYNFSQIKKYLVAYYLARNCFIRKGQINRRPKDYSLYEETLNFGEIYSFAYGEAQSKNYWRNYRTLVDYILEILELFTNRKIISNYHVEYDYTEDDKFQLKHQYDYDINLNLDYKFTTKDLDSNVTISITIDYTTY